MRSRRFARKWDIRLDSTVRFRTAEFDNGTLVINLKSHEKVTAPNRKGPHPRPLSADCPI